MLYERKIYPALILILTLSGSLIAAFLIFDAVLPARITSLLDCSAEGCSPFVHTPYARSFGIPFASIQLFYYLWIFLSFFLFNESGSSYAAAFRMLVPFAALSAFIHIAVYTGPMFRVAFCPYTLALTVIDILLLVITVYTVIKKTGSVKALLAEYSEGLNHLDISDDRRFSTGTFIYFSAILLLFIIAFSLFIDMRYSRKSNTDVPVRKSLLDKYLEQTLEKAVFPKTSIVYGDEDAPLVIDVFTDPMCGACEAFHNSQSALLEKYNGRLSIRYYFHPLESACNESMKSDIHPGACMISEILYAAAQNGIYDDTIRIYYSRRQNVSETIRSGADITEIVGMIVDDPEMALKVNATIVSGSAREELASHIDAGNKIDIKATPTLFIRGRRIEGNASIKSFSEIFDYLLDKK